MSKISNTTVYPNVLPTANDYVVLTDVTDSDKTKTATVADFQLFFGITTLEVTLTSTQLLNCFTNPVTVVPAQGAGTYIVPQGIVVSTVNFNTVAYDFPNIAELGYSLTEVYMEWSQATLNSGSSGVFAGPFSVNGPLGGIAQPIVGAENTDLLFLGVGSNPTVGDGTLTLNFQYKVITI